MTKLEKLVQGLAPGIWCLNFAPHDFEAQRMAGNSQPLVAMDVEECGDKYGPLQKFPLYWIRYSWGTIPAKVPGVAIYKARWTKTLALKEKMAIGPALLRNLLDLSFQDLTPRYLKEVLPPNYWDEY